MNGRDLFGREARLPGLRADPPAESPNLLDYAAQLAALASGRSVAQERAEIVAPAPSADGLPLFDAGPPCEP